MSRTPCFFLEKYNFKSKKYERIAPLVWNWEHTEREPADLFPFNGCHEMFSIVEGRGGEFPDMNGIHQDLPDDVSEEISNIFIKDCKEVSDYSVGPHARYFTYADMYIYLLKYPKIYGWDEEKEKSGKIRNPLFQLKERVDAFLEVEGEFCWNYVNEMSNIRIVYWIF